MPARKFRKISSQELDQNTSVVHSSSERRHRMPAVIAEPPTASFQSKMPPAVNSTEIPPEMETPLQLKEEVKTQRAKLLEEYSVIFDDVLKLLLMKEADSRIGTPCCCGSAPRELRRLSDNVFTGNVPDPIKQFMFVARIWTLLKAEKCSGKAYLGGMNILNPSRPKDTVQVLCPICPEAGVNVPLQWLQQPPALHHLYSQHFCLDGNMKLINYGKKNDSNNVSLFAGRAYMAEESSFKHYLATVPQIQKDKVICNHLKVVNSANRAKFKNMGVTSVVTCQCNHGFIWSSVDLVRGENHASVDLALELAVASRPFNDGKEPNRIGSYDNMCSLCVHIVDRWRKYHPNHAKDVEKMRWTISACHVRNHVVGLEKPWANLNALGPSVQQMSPGHRIDTLIDQYSDWNQQKVVGAARQLLKEIDDAKVQYVRKRDHFVGLCQLYRRKVEVWTALNRSPCVDPQSKCKVISVYSHNDEKAPTLKALVDSMMASKDVITVPSGNELLGAVKAPLSRASLELQSPKKRYMRTISSHFSSPEQHPPELVSLLLPSDFTLAECTSLWLLSLATKQVQMVEVALGEIINTLQMVHARGEEQNTRSLKQIRGIIKCRDNLIADYARYRKVLKGLDSLDCDKWPVLSAKDTFCKSTEQRRTPGDGRVLEGNLWGMTSAGHSSVQADNAGLLIFGTSKPDDDHYGTEDPMLELEGESFFGTRMALRQAKQLKVVHTPQEPPQPSHHPSTYTMEEAEEDPVGVSTDGWIWAAGCLSNMNEDEIREWEEISNHVQFFCTEADYETWQEELEQKHADFVFLIGSFTKQWDDWVILAKNFSSTPGHVVYAKEHSNMFEALRADAGLKYKRCGIRFLEEKHFAFDRWKDRPAFRDPTLHVDGFADCREAVVGEEDHSSDSSTLKAKIRHLTVDWTFCALFNCLEYLVFNGAV
ncbi:hypothetical protein F5050DRAFT_1803226 [Lentinula boryana]|uniref:CxC2-like cysteine cluster KDZ transposase-associated domain-containing protein n=1 Tax=Lentinula boryana TaxID=40481 RepID=A0ABQ8QT28_9AGAR|nr:hypothetical protein F5050DRAFT_1803226 [Lentinula boryana]